MNPQAENRFTVTKPLFYEGMLRLSRDTYGKFASRAMLVFFAIWAVLLLFTLLTGGNLNSVLFCLGVIVLLGVWLCIWTPRNNAKKAWRSLQSQYGDSAKRITRFYNDHLEISGDCAEKSVSYTDIREIKQSKNLILLVGFDKVGIMLAKDGFTRGDGQTIYALIGGNKIKE